MEKHAGACFLNFYQPSGTNSISGRINSHSLQRKFKFLDCPARRTVMAATRTARIFLDGGRKRLNQKAYRACSAILTQRF